MELTNNLKVVMMLYNRVPANEVKDKQLNMIELTDEETKFINEITASEPFADFLLNKFKSRGI